MKALRNGGAKLAVSPEELGRPVADVVRVVDLVHGEGLGRADAARESRAKGSGGGERHHEGGEDGHGERGEGARSFVFCG